MEIPLKLKYRIGGKAQKGYKVPSGGGDSTKKRPHYHKASDAQKKIINSKQPKMIKIVNGQTGHSVMKRV